MTELRHSLVRFRKYYGSFISRQNLNSRDRIEDHKKIQVERIPVYNRVSQRFAARQPLAAGSPNGRELEARWT
jgi:hypothetical protein